MGFRPPFRPRARPASNPFHLPLDAEIVAKAQQAVDMAQASGGEVTLFTNGIPVQAVVASLVFSQVGFGADRMAQGELTEAESDGLLKAVQRLASTKLLLVENGLPSAMNGADENGDPARVIVLSSQETPRPAIVGAGWSGLLSKHC
jgi:hypothetical protein